MARVHAPGECIVIGGQGAQEHEQESGDAHAELGALLVCGACRNSCRTWLFISLLLRSIRFLGALLSHDRLPMVLVVVGRGGFVRALTGFGSFFPALNSCIPMSTFASGIVYTYVRISGHLVRVGSPPGPSLSYVVP